MYLASLASILLALLGTHQAKSPIDTFNAAPPVRIHHHAVAGPSGLSPTQVKAAYNLPSTGGTGTIAIIDAYDSRTIATDLNTFSKTYELPTCSTTTVTCFEKHEMSGTVRQNSSWAIEESLDVEWAHAIAPTAKILLVEANSSAGSDLLSAVNYAESRPGVVAISMSWGGPEFSGESAYDQDFTSPNHISFFASAGDSGTGVSWPAVSPNVIGVGGTTLNMKGDTVVSETAWSGSGGGVSRFEPEPTYQHPLVTTSGNFRATPDVSYDADPNTGYPIYDSTRYNGEAGWWQIGGTSAGAPQWAAISTLGTGVTATKLYQDAAANYKNYFRDIVSGTNGTCNFVCQARSGYDYVTGLGSPATTKF
jgi:subtilase family serine protease